MPVGATIAAATVTAGATIASSNKASKGAKQAVAAETSSNNAALALQQHMYDQTRSDNEPWRQVGLGALQQLASTYGINVPQGTWSGQAQPAPMQQQQAAAPVEQPQAKKKGGLLSHLGLAGALAGHTVLGGVLGLDDKGGGEGVAGNATVGQPQPIQSGGVIQAPPTGQTNTNYFAASPDYQFRLNEGLRAVSGNRMARGLIDSGSMGEGLIKYAGDSASQEFGNWFSRLSTLAGYGSAANGMNAASGQANANAQQGIIQNEGANRASGYATRGGIQSGLINGVGNIGAGIIKNWPTGGSAGGTSYGAQTGVSDFAGLY